MGATVDPDATLRQLAREYLGSLLEGDLAAARAGVANARLDGVAPAHIYQDVVARALEDIGRMWELKELSIADEHMASEISSAVLSSLWPIAPASLGAPSVIVACPAAEGHALGAKAVATGLAELGWNAVHLGARTPTDALVMLAEAREPDVVALSVKLPWHLGEVRDAVRALRALPRPPAILVGGTAVRNRPDDLGADAVADDLTEALAWARGAFPWPH